MNGEPSSTIRISVADREKLDEFCRRTKRGPMLALSWLIEKGLQVAADEGQAQPAVSNPADA